jgi:DNA mismatch repair protein MutS
LRRHWARRNYGLQVAQLAGVPLEVIAAAHDYLAAHERQRDAVRPGGGPQYELPLNSAKHSAANAPQPDVVRAALEAIDPDEMSPKEPLEALYRLGRLLSGTSDS